jgi:Lipopolysaccharide-assembly
MFASCEVKYSMLDQSIDADTFSVEIFEERAANAPAGFGIDFTEFLRDFVVSRSKLKLNKTNADIEISGKIGSYYTSPVSIQSDEQAATNRLTVVVEVSVINNKDEKQSFEKSFSQFSDYESSLDLSAVEEDLIEDINEKLSQDIVNQLSSNW